MIGEDREGQITPLPPPTIMVAQEVDRSREGRRKDGQETSPARPSSEGVMGR